MKKKTREAGFLMPTRVTFKWKPRCPSCLLQQDQVNIDWITGPIGSARRTAQVLCASCGFPFDWPVKYEEDSA